MLSENNADQPVSDQHSYQQRLLASSEPFSINTTQNSNLQSLSPVYIFYESRKYANNLVKNAVTVI